MTAPHANPVLARALAEGMAVTDHTDKGYDEELEALRRAVVDMGGLAQSMVADATVSLAGSDVELAQEVAAARSRFVDLRRRVDSSAVLTIARRAPVAADLREVVAAIRIAADLGRVARHAVSIADCAARIGSTLHIPRAILGHQPMSVLAVELLKDALLSYARRDAEGARAVWERDQNLDALESFAYDDLIGRMIEDPRGISFCMRMMSATKDIERIGDHATNIAETVVYLVTGEALQDERPRGGETEIQPGEAGDFDAGSNRS